MRCVKGSTTVEMAYVMPLIFLVFLIIVRTTFYYHDKSILDGMAYEAVTTAVQTARNPKAKEADVETFCRERIRWKLIYFSMPEVSVNVTDDEAETTISATRGKMCIRVTRQVKIPHPEKKIRLKKKLETIKQVSRKFVKKECRAIMVIEKVINNNIVSAYDDTGKEVVIMGRGIGFGTKPGREVAEQKIEKIFRIKSQSLADQFKELLANMPLEHAQISNDIISHAKKHLKLKLNQSIYVTLTDHINFAIERFTQGIKPENALLWEIKRFYQQEYQLGKYAVDMIWERLHIALPDDEAGFIALHFVNAEYGTDIRDALNFPNLMKDILDIVKSELNMEFDEDSLHYERFVTHVKFLLQRVYRKELLPNEESELAEMMMTKYPREYACSRKVADYIEDATNSKISGEEIMYLAIHIRRVTMAEE